MHLPPTSSFLTLFCLAAATAQAAVLRPAELGSRNTPLPRATSDPVLRAIKSHRGGKSVCSSFLSMPSYAATKTSVIIKTVTRSLPAATTTAQVGITNTASSTVTVVKTIVDVSSVTPTQFVTVTASSSPSSAPQVDRSRRAASSQPLPDWLTQYSSPEISAACSKVVVPRTKTVRKTSTTTKMAQSTVAILQTSTVIVTPTITSVITVQATETEPAVTSMIIVAPPSSTSPTSALPSSIQGRIKIVDPADGSSVGYWSAVLSSQGSSFIDADDSQALIIEVPTDGSTFNLDVGSEALDGDVTYLGAIVPWGRGVDLGNVGDRRFTYVYAGAVPIGAAGVQQTSTNTSIKHAFLEQNLAMTYESQIWRYNVITKELTIDWTNSDSSTFTPTLASDEGHLYWAPDAPGSPLEFGTPVQAFLQPL